MGHMQHDRLTTSIESQASDHAKGPCAVKDEQGLGTEGSKKSAWGHEW
jgi:hypothetical protein